MQMIRRFFIYIVILVTVLILTYGYVYWGDLFGKNTPAGQLISWTFGKKQTTDAPDLVALPAEQPVEEMVGINETPVAEEPVEDTAPVLTEPASTEVVPAEISTPVEPPADLNLLAEPEQPPQSTVIPEQEQAPAQEVSLSDLWKRARHSFHYRDYETSVDSYQQIIARTQDNFDAFEELGDVYAYYGRNDEAATAYYQAAVILVRLGKLERAAKFMKPLSLMDITKARQLLDLMEATKKK